MNSADFEQRLKQIRPVDCDDRLAETFYQSGWQACEAAIAKPVVIANEKQTVETQTLLKRLPSFMTGAVCGILVCAMGFFLRPDTVVETRGSQQVVDHPVSNSPSESRAQADGVRTNIIADNRLEANQPESTHSSSYVRGWQLDEIFVASPLMVERPSPLSLASRHSWSNQILDRQRSERRVSESNESDGQPTRTSLTASPLNGNLLRELML